MCLNIYLYAYVLPERNIFFPGTQMHCTLMNNTHTVCVRGMMLFVCCLHGSGSSLDLWGLFNPSSFSPWAPCKCLFCSVEEGLWLAMLFPPPPCTFFFFFPNLSLSCYFINNIQRGCQSLVGKESLNQWHFSSAMFSKCLKENGS